MDDAQTDALKALGWLAASSAHPHNAEIVERVKIIGAALASPRGHLNKKQKYEAVIEAARDYAVALANDLDEVGKLAPARNKQLRAAIDDLLSASPSLASAKAGDWRSDADVQRILDEQACDIRPTMGGGSAPIWMFTEESLDALCDAVQSHARAASPPVPESPSPEKKP